MAVALCMISCSTGSENGSDSAAGNAASENVYKKLVLMYNNAAEKVKSASSIAELDSINNKLDEEQRLLKEKSADEISRIREAVLKNPASYIGDIEAEQDAWNIYEEAYLNKLMELK